MKAACFIEPGKVEVEDRPRPTIEDKTDAVIKVVKTAICGSDLHFYTGKIPLEKGFVLGHEILGVVEDVGSGVSVLKPGDRVVVSDMAACGKCWYCQRRYFVNCSASKTFGAGQALGNLAGGQTDYVRVPYADTTCGVTPAQLSDEQALFVGDILVTGYTCAKNGDIQPGDTVVVIGCGPVGMFAQMCARLFGPAQVIAVDMLPSRLAMAKQFGAIPVDGSDPKAARKLIREMTGGRGADVVLEAVGGEAPFQMGGGFLRPKGRLSVVGVSSTPIRLPAAHPLFNEWTIRFGVGDSPRYRDELFALIQSGRLEPDLLITHRMKLEQAAHAYQIFNEREAFKIVLDP